MEAKTKRRYNTCHRLRARGVLVDVDNHRISLTTAQFAGLDKTSLRYIEVLTSDFRYNVQWRLPGTEPSSTVGVELAASGQPAIKFVRRRKN